MLSWATLARASRATLATPGSRSRRRTCTTCSGGNSWRSWLWSTRALCAGAYSVYSWKVRLKKNLRYDLLHLNRKQQKRNCKYCLKELRGKDRTHKTDEGRRPYCVHCYEKLLGHFGNAQTKREELPPLAT